MITWGGGGTWFLPGVLHRMEASLSFGVAGLSCKIVIMRAGIEFMTSQPQLEWSHPLVFQEDLETVEIVACELRASRAQR